MRTKQERRFATVLAKRKSKARCKEHDTLSGNFRDDAARIGREATTRAMCSCFMCGNPRKHFGSRTRQENSQLEVLAQFMKERQDAKD